MTYGRKEITVFLIKLKRESRGLQDPKTIDTEKLWMLICSNLGWRWNVDDVGRAPCRHNPTEQSALEGFYRFIDETKKLL